MKRILSLLLSMAVLICAFSSCAEGHFSFDGKEGKSAYVTRGEWARMLGDTFGMDSCLSAEPYYGDVPADSVYFPYVQSGTEWEVFELGDKKFEPEKEATVQFVVESAVKAAEVDYSGYSDILDFAREQGAVSEDGGAKDKVTEEFAAEVCAWALDLYRNREFEEYENIVISDSVIGMTDVAAKEDGSFVLKEESVKPGDVVVTAPTPEDIAGVARKVTSVEPDGDGGFIVHTEEPEIGDIFEELDFAYEGAPESASLIQTPEGVELTGFESASSMGFGQDEKTLAGSLVDYGQGKTAGQMKAPKSVNMTFAINLSSEKSSDGTKSTGITLSQEFIEGLELAEEFAKETGNDDIKDLYEETGLLPDKEEKKMTATDKYTKGWEVEGSLSLKNFYVTTELETKKAFGVPYGIKSVGYEVHYEVESSLKFSGKIEEEMTIAMVPLALGGSGITVNVEIFVKSSITGDLTVSSKLTSVTSVKYTDKNGFKKTQESNGENSVSVSVDIRTGFGGKATLKAWGISLIDFSIEVGMGFTASAKLTQLIRYEGGLYKAGGGEAALSKGTEEYLVCVDGTVYFPTVTVSLGTSNKTLAYKLGIKLKWKAMDKSGATFKSQTINVHYEPGKGIVDQCTLDGLEELITEEEVSEALEKDREEKSEENETGVGGDLMNISAYALSMKQGETVEISVTDMPYGYTGNEVVWKSDDNSVVEISRIVPGENTAVCELKAVGPGTTSITVETSDGLHYLRCAVTVSGDETISFTPME